MRFPSVLRAAAIAVTALFGAGLTAAHADSGSVSLRIYKAGFVIGGSAGSGVLHFHGHVSHIRRPSDIAGVYAQGGAGAAVGRGAQAVVLTNQNGAVLTLSGEQAGVIVSLDLSGLALSLK